MTYTDLIFDLYGTLVDIHTEESAEVWEKTALYFGFYGARYTGAELKRAFEREMAARQAKAGQSYECFPDIPFEQVMDALFRKKGICTEGLGQNAAQLFRIASMEHLRLYPHVLEALAALRAKGFRLWLLSNAQRVFTAYELRYLGLGEQFDGIYLSSDYNCRKPDRKFFAALLDEQKLDPARCLMIGNDRETDIAGRSERRPCNALPAHRAHPARPGTGGPGPHAGKGPRRLPPLRIRRRRLGRPDGAAVQAVTP